MRFVLDDEKKELFEEEERFSSKFLPQAKSTINGNLMVQYGLDSIPFKNKIDWNYQHRVSSNTYKLYLHTLHFIRTLVFGYINLGDNKYQIKAQEYLMDWIENNYKILNNTEKVWYDHTVSSRIQNIIYFQMNVDDQYKIDNELFSELVKYHLDFLMNPQNYNESNHGLMVDAAIIKIAMIIEDENQKNYYISFAKSRVEKAILRDYSYLNMHLENSPSYHRMVTNMLFDINELLTKAETPLADKYIKKLEKSESLLGVMVSYNGELPMIGDTPHVKTNFKKQHDDFVDYEAGIAILNNEKAESTLIFNNGFQNYGHKHYDDLSFMLSIKKEPIITDSGRFNYSSKHPTRKYIISPKAHSALIVKNKSYKLQDKDMIKLSSYMNFGNYKYISGIHEAYNRIKIKRVILIFNGVDTIVIDSARSTLKNDYIQNFILHQNLQVNKINDKEYNLITPKKHEYILKTHRPNTIIEKYYGKKNNAIISEKFSEIIETNRLEIKQTKDKALFITSILDKESTLENIKASFSSIEFNLNGKEYTIPLY